MASYQEIETKLETLERLVLFMATSLRMRAAVPSPVLGPTGEEQTNIFEGSILELYRMANQMPVVRDSDV
jgi:hypothetical protein